MIVSIAQTRGSWLNKKQGILKILDFIEQASSKQSKLIVFSEGMLPGYPFWLSLTAASNFDSAIQKECYAYYLNESICIENGELDPVLKQCEKHKIACYLGIIERPISRGGHSLYCSLIYIDQSGKIKSIHRKLIPTYEERLVWGIGDGNGLVCHDLEEFRLGGLNCWENWMPLSRTALYAQAENLHVAVWPGSDFNTKDITRFIARESRSYVISVSTVMHSDDIPDNFPLANEMKKECPNFLTNGGSCIANPDGTWLIEPQLFDEQLIFADLNLLKVEEERQNFDPSGHYARPDVFSLEVNRKRNTPVSFKESTSNDLNKDKA